MKKLSYVLIFIIMIIINYSNVYAKSVTISCPSSVKAGSNFNCSVNANYDKEYGGVELIPVFSNGISFSGFSIGSGYSGYMTNSILSVISDDNKKGNSSVGTINLFMNKDVNSSQTITFTNVKIIDSDYNNIGCDNYSVTINIDNSVVDSKPSTNNNQNNNNKSSNSNNNKPNNSWYNNTNNGVNKDDDKKEISTKIDSINLSNGSIDFNKDIYEYSIDVDNSVTKIDLDIKLEDDKAKIEITGNDNLEVGNNTITIVVTGSDNNTSTYTINVNRLDKSSESRLKSLKIKGYKIKFDKDKYEYYINIKDKDIGNSLDIETITLDDKARVVIGGNKDIDNGKIINIIVEAEDNSTSMYIIKIINYNIGEFIYGMIGSLISIIVIALIIIIKRKK